MSLFVFVFVFVFVCQLWKAFWGLMRCRAALCGLFVGISDILLDSFGEPLTFAGFLGLSVGV